MGVKVNTDGLQNCSKKLEECVWGLEDTKNNLQKCKFPDDENYKASFERNLNTIKTYTQQTKEKIENYKKDVNNVIKDFNNAEAKNKQISSEIIATTVTGLSTKYSNSGYSNTTTPSADILEGIDDEGIQTEKQDNVGALDQDSVGLKDDNGVQTDNPTDTEINKDEQDVGLEGNVPDTQVEAVIELIYGEDTTIPDDTKERIVEAISEINKTEILDGLDEDIANQIRAEIVKDYLDGELELEGIEAEDLQEYIESQPSIKIQFEMDEALARFDSLIESGVLTKNQIKTVIEENIEIHDDQEFEKLYIENGGIETEVSNIESFYDSETQKVHIRNTVESETITVAIVTVLGDVLFYNEETGEISYKNVEDLNQDVNANIGDSQVDSSTTDVENPETDVNANIGDNQVDSSATDVENPETDVNANIGDNQVDSSATDVKNPETDVNANIGDNQVDSSVTDVENPEVDVNTNMGDGQTDSSSTNVEDFDTDTTIEMPESEFERGTFTNIGNIGKSNTTTNTSNSEQ